MFTRRLAALAASIGLAAAVAPALASDIGHVLADQVSVPTYRYHLDLLYVHDGHSRSGPGIAQHDLARDNIAAVFGSLGLVVQLEHIEWDGANVVATKVGTTYPDAQYIVGAHYDSSGTPGADDDASGVAALLELARVLSLYEPEYTVKFIAFDLEEGGLIGSKRYVQQHSSDDIRGMIQMDMIAWDSGAYTTRVLGWTTSDPLKMALAAAVAEYGGNLTASLGGPFNQSDHASFERAGFQACLLIERQYSSNPCYHAPCDSVDTLDYFDIDFAVDHVRSVAGFLADHAMVHYPTDCNGNGVLDADEIASDPSLDQNSNGVLDECEPMLSDDCNLNGIPDPQEILTDPTLDCNLTGILDICEPDCHIDCNQNGSYDVCDLWTLASQDFNHDDIPDECQRHGTICVDDDAPEDPGPNDPTVGDPLEDGSAAHPFDSIAEAVAHAVSTDEVVLADGVYSGPGNRAVVFHGPAITLRGANGPDACIIDCGNMDVALRAGPNARTGTRIEGLTIVNAKGSAIRCPPGTMVNDCVLMHNREGSAIASASTISNCTLMHNQGIQGGAISRVGSVVNCLIARNTSGEGGGIYAPFSFQALHIESCVIVENSGGGIVCDGPATIQNCFISGNNASRGGGIRARTGSVTLANSLFVGNVAALQGSAIWTGAQETTITNCIFNVQGTIGGTQLAVEGYSQRPALLSVSYSNVSGGQSAIYLGNYATLLWGDGNIDADPLFADRDGADDDIYTWEDNDYRLSAGSPCIDAGDPSYAATPGTVDLDGAMRVWDGDGDGAPRVDMGAYEFGSFVYADVNCDDRVNAGDIPAFILAITDPAAYDAAYPGCNHHLADLNADGQVNQGDVGPFIDRLIRQ